MKKIYLLVSCLLLVACGPDAPEEKKLPYEIQTISARDLSKEVTIERAAIMKAGSQVTITAQTGGRIAYIGVRSGQKVTAGQILGAIEDTYGGARNSRDEAAIALETAKLNRENSELTLNQSVAGAKVALEKAQKDYEGALLDTTPDEGGKSKAQLEYENYIATQEKTLSGYETTYQSQLQSFQSFLTNVIETSDSILGVSDEKRNQNDGYENLLGALDTPKKTAAEDALRKLLVYKNWSPSNTLSLVERVTELQKVYLLAHEVLAGVENVLMNTVPDSFRLPATTITGYKTTIDGYQTQYSGISSGLVTYINTAQTFLATYQKDRLAREKTLQTAQENTKEAFELAKSAYETAEKNKSITLQQLEKNVESAKIRYQNATSGINKLQITAPVTGTIGKILIDEGEEVSPGKNLMEIASNDAECDITVDARIVGQLEVGHAVTLLYRGETLAGKISSISPIADRGLNFSIKVSLDSPVAFLGDFATVRIPLVSPFPTIPLTAIDILSPGQGHIHVLSTRDDNTYSVTEKNVLLGSLWGERVEILSDLGEEEIILSSLKNYNASDFILEKK